MNRLKEALESRTAYAIRSKDRFASYSALAIGILFCARAAPIHRIKIVWDSPQAGKEPYDSMFPIGEIVYRARDGKAVETGLAGRTMISGGRVDIRLGMDNEENLHIPSKVDGTIREVVGATVSEEK